MYTKTFNDRPISSTTTNTKKNCCVPSLAAPPPQDAFLRSALVSGTMLNNVSLLPQHANLFVIVGSVATKDIAAPIYLAVLHPDALSTSTSTTIYRLSHDTYAANLLYLREVCGCDIPTDAIRHPAVGSLIMGTLPPPSSSPWVHGGSGGSSDTDIELLETGGDVSGGVALWGSYEACMGAIIELKGERGEE